MTENAKAILFDLDGVIMRTDRLHFTAWKKVCDSRNWHFDEKVNDLLRGVPRLESLRIILRHNGVVLSEAEELELAERKNLLFRKSLKTLSSGDLIPGALELVKGLRALGVKTAICSSSRNAKESVAAVRIGALFDGIVTGADVVKAKPDPEIFLAGAKLVNVPPALCVVVEDAQAGIDAANAAGMRSVAYCASGEDLRGATLLVRSFVGLAPECLLALGAISR